MGIKKIILFCAFVCSFQGITQTNFFLIARTTGEKIVASGDTIRVFGYASSFSTQPPVPAPLLDVVEGDSVFIDFLNMSQGHAHTIHLHGLDVDQWNDGVPALSFEVPHLGQEIYKFKAPHPGTYLYHCHVGSTIHLQAGMYGPIIVRPQSGPNFTWDGGYEFDQELMLFCSEIDSIWHKDSILNHMHSGNPMMDTLRIPNYDPNYFLVNGLSDQQKYDSLELNTSVGAKAYLRLVNIGYCGNKFILPAGLNAQVVSSDGRPLPQVEVTDTIEIYPGERYGVICEANSEFIDSIQIHYEDLNTGVLKNVQYVEVNVSGFNDIVNLDKKAQIKTYPNPSRNQFEIEFEMLKEEKATLSVLDEQGRLVKSVILNCASGLNTFLVETSGLTSGKYHLHVKFQTGTLISRIIVLK